MRWAVPLALLAGRPGQRQEPFKLGVQTHFEQGWGCTGPASPRISAPR